MAAFTKYQDTVQRFWEGLHQLHAAGHAIHVVIHTDAPVVATDSILTDLTQITGTGYTAGGSDTQNDMTETTGTATWTGVDVVWTAGAADWTATARYVSLQNNTALNKNLLGSWDYGSTFALANGETFTVDFGASVGTLA